MKLRLMTLCLGALFATSALAAQPAAQSSPVHVGMYAGLNLGYMSAHYDQLDASAGGEYISLEFQFPTIALANVNLGNVDVEFSVYPVFSAYYDSVRGDLTDSQISNYLEGQYKNKENAHKVDVPPEVLKKLLKNVKVYLDGQHYGGAVALGFSLKTSNHIMAALSLGGFYEGRYAGAHASYPDLPNTANVVRVGGSDSELTYGANKQGGFYMAYKVGYSSIELGAKADQGFFLGLVGQAFFTPQNAGDDAKNFGFNRRMSIGVEAGYSLSF